MDYDIAFMLEKKQKLKVESHFTVKRKFLLF